jgi:hypothetical protein
LANWDGGAPAVGVLGQSHRGRLLELESFSFLDKKQMKAAQAGNPEDGRRTSLGGMLRNSIDLSSALGQKKPRSAGWT